MNGDRHVVGPREPGETLDRYLQRVIKNAGRPTDEQVARLANLLGMTSDRCGDGDG